MMRNTFFSACQGIEDDEQAHHFDIGQDCQKDLSQKSMAVKRPRIVNWRIFCFAKSIAFFQSQLKDILILYRSLVSACVDHFT